MIHELRLKNFKGWMDTGPLRLAPITGLFGSNSSGKTSILQALLLLKQTTDSVDRARVFDLGSDRSITSLGTYYDVIHRHEVERELNIQLAWKPTKRLDIKDPAGKDILFSGESLEFSVSVSAERRDPIVDELRYSVDDAHFIVRRKAGKKSAYSLSAETPSNFKFLRVRGRAWDVPAPVKCYGFPDQVRAYYQNAGFLSDLELAFEELFDQTFYLGPLRDDPHRQYTWGGGRPQDVGSRGENAIEALIASRSDPPQNSRGFVHRVDGKRRLKRLKVEEHVAAWLKQLGLIHSFRVESVDRQQTLFSVPVKRTAQSTEVLLPDIGFGVSQVLPILVLLAYVPEHSTVILEQPEIHLHPAVQAELADVFIEAALARNIQLIIESHSEHLLLRLQRRIAEMDLDRGLAVHPRDVAFYFCDVVAGRATVEELKVDLFGNIENWPRNFFGDSFAEAAHMTEASIKRQEEGSVGAN
jgi:predicted ATPase